MTALALAELMLIAELMLLILHADSLPWLTGTPNGTEPSLMNVFHLSFELCHDNVFQEQAWVGQNEFPQRSLAHISTSGEALGSRLA